MNETPKRSSDQKTILILEDQGLVRAGMRELIHITEPEAKIVEVSCYEDAVKALSEYSFDFFFLDIDLNSTHDGRDVLAFIRSHEINVRTIMLSASSDKSLVLECLNLGASGFISKNSDSDEVFRNALNTVFEGGIFIPLDLFEYDRINHRETPTETIVSAETLGIAGRSLEVLYYLCQGLPNKTIACKMNVEEGTIRKHYVPKLFRIFRVARRTELLIEVSRLGIRTARPEA